ncbi:hypothetical protein [Streptomyces sp. Isolate_219]|uniref:hypothetical protein n=1 Tax=Streptomyces sp. Isolate_219 TaxID=2950110 RepID=UPI0021C68734|nr:hypothetical protein [Streptomyces sp. Isolate_219]MCR8574016.1 hypothetical protein [Streptomyces sp. Isolate_219]
MSNAPLRLLHGYWCECSTTNFSEAGQQPFLVASFDTATPLEAIRWIRIALRTVASALVDESAQQAWHWLTHGHRQALKALQDREGIALTIRHRTTLMSWSARPVIYLPLAHRNGARLPHCSEVLATRQLRSTAE